MHRRTITDIGRIVPGNDGRWVRRGVALAIGGYAVVTILGVFFGAQSALDLIFQGMVLAVGLVAVVLIARGRVNTAARLFLGAIWIDLVSEILFTADIAAPSAVVFPAVVLAIGLFQGGRAALRAALWTTIAVPAATILGHGILAPHILPQFSIEHLVVFTVTIWGTAILVHMALGTMDKLLNAALASERKFADLVNNAPDGMLSVDAEGHVVSANPAAARMLGTDIDQMVGEPIDDMAPELSDQIRGSGPCPEQDDDDCESDEKTSAEVIVLDHAGGTVAAEASSSAVTLSDGSAGVQVTLRDISERRSAVELASQLGGIVENALNEIYVFHAVSWQLLKVNRGGRENLGYTAEELEHLTVSQVNPTLGPIEGREILERLGSTEGAVLSVRGVHRRKDGSLYPVEAQLQAGTLFGEPVVIAFAVDVSQREESEQEQRRLQAQLEHAQKMEAVGHLAGGVAHDFNNLLTVVGGYAALLQASEDDETRELATEIARAHERGASLTRQLLAFARKEVAQPRVVSLSTVVNDMERILLRVLGERFELRIVTSGDGYITADPGQLEQVLLNLVANARDAMPEGGMITIGVADGGADKTGSPMIRLEVSDNGVGMDANTIRQIFQPFFTTKPRGKGTGLGLSTVHGIVVQNDGTVDVESKPGEGTVIRVLWPRSEAPAPTGPELSRSGQAAEGTGTVLVAEDDDALRALVIRLLESAGFNVLAARHGTHALEVCDSHSGDIDLLLTDMVMPGLNGIDLAEQVRASRPGVPVLFMSGYLDGDLHGDRRVDQARELILKPFRGPELLDRIHGTLAGAGRPQAR